MVITYYNMMLWYGQYRSRAGCNKWRDKVVRYFRQNVRCLLFSRLFLHSARRHAGCRRPVHTDTPTQFPVSVRPNLPYYRLLSLSYRRCLVDKEKERPKEDIRRRKKAKKQTKRKTGNPTQFPVFGCDRNWQHQQQRLWKSIPMYDRYWRVENLAESKATQTVYWRERRVLELDLFCDGSSSDSWD